MGGEAVSTPSGSRPRDSTIDLLDPPTSTRVEAAMARFVRLMRDRYGRNLRGVYLFGSRARGDAKPFSDVDLAIVVSDSARNTTEVADLSGVAYEVFLETGAEIQPWVFGTSEWEHPAEAAEAMLLRSIRHDARPIWVST